VFRFLQLIAPLADKNDATAGCSRFASPQSFGANVNGSSSIGEAIEEAGRILLAHPNDHVVFAGDNCLQLGASMINMVSAWHGRLPDGLAAGGQPYNRLTYEQMTRTHMMVISATFPTGRLFNVAKIVVVINHIYNLAKYQNIVAWPADPDGADLCEMLYVASTAVDPASAFQRNADHMQYLGDLFARLEMYFGA